MKKFLFIALCAALLSSTVSVPVSAYDATDKLVVDGYQSDSIVVDGKLDEGYGPLYALEQEGAAHTFGLDLTKGKIAVAWNASKLYVYTEVYEAGTPFAVSETDWKNDGPEFFFDMLNASPTTYDENCFRVRIIAAQDKEGSVWTSGLSFNGSNSDVAVSCASTDDIKYVVQPLNGSDWKDGYSVEMSYDYSPYFDPYSIGDSINWEAQIVDDVFGFGSRDSQAFLGNPNDTAWGDPSQFGSTIKLMAKPNAAAGAETTAEATDKPKEPATTEPAKEPATTEPAKEPATTEAKTDTTADIIAPQTSDPSIVLAIAGVAASLVAFMSGHSKIRRQNKK